jgi:hypothetical protein
MWKEERVCDYGCVARLRCELRDGGNGEVLYVVGIRRGVLDAALFAEDKLSGVGREGKGSS